MKFSNLPPHALQTFVEELVASEEQLLAQNGELQVAVTILRTELSVKTAQIEDLRKKNAKLQLDAAVEAFELPVV